MRNQGIMWTAVGVLITIMGTSVIDGWLGSAVAVVGVLVTVYGAVQVFRSRSQDRPEDL